MKLTDYIQGQQKGKDAHRIEKEAMKDPFLSDALDGFDRITGNHLSRIENMKKHITASTRAKTGHLKYRNIAASILLILSLGGYWLMREKNTSPVKELYSYDEKMKKTIPAEENIPEPVSPQTNTQYSKKQNQHAAEKKIHESPKPVTKKSPVQNIKGQITDSRGEPLAGASITQQGTNRSVISDIQGHFSLNTTDTGSLKISYLGYENKKIPLDSAKHDLLIAMHDDELVLNEVVVVSYGTQKKQSMVGSISRIATPDKIPNKKPKPVIGKKAYRKYLIDNMIHPTDDACKDVKGNVKLSFTVNANTRPDKITIIKSLCPSADQEAIRLIQEGPDWMPGNKAIEITIKF
ncbi:MAG: carboxypeptidase-like regulatory domain-containing protein [Dysgonamonadaceae bacterium]|jgi:hypothetical protein|nr:carboxypeptidase-like regulatory domain-containing protein [Dysgonamonadaceae bacterium]